MTIDARHARVLEIMRLAPVIPVLTVRDVEDGVAQARALVAGGLALALVVVALAAFVPALRVCRQEPAVSMRE